MTANIFQDVKSSLQPRLAQIVADLLPGGKLHGKEYSCALKSGSAIYACNTSSGSAVNSGSTKEYFAESFANVPINIDTQDVYFATRTSSSWRICAYI